MNLSNQNLRNTIYFDESGVPNIRDKGKYFILSGVIGNNLEFNSLSEYYFRLKRKYYDEERSLHSIDLFWRPTNSDILFINELRYFLLTLDFNFITIIIDKEELLRSVSYTSPKNPYSTTFSRSKALCEKRGISKMAFLNKSIKEVLDLIREEEFLDISNFYPLEISFKKILNEYIKQSVSQPEFEICFETSPNRERIIGYTDSFLREKTFFSDNLGRLMYSISFPNKGAKYLGLEIADIISYGFNLYKYKRIQSVPSYVDIWEIIWKKEVKKKSVSKYLCVYNT